MKKFIIRVLPVVFVIFVISISTIYAAGYNSGYITGDHPSQKGTLQLNAIGRNLIKISSVIMRVFQLIAVGGIIYAGVRYMYAGAEIKSEIKKSLIKLAIGCVILFGGSTIANLIVKSFNEAIV